MYGRDGSGRCVWIDVAKGVGIALVVLGHMDIPEPLRQYVYCFHVPLFFFLSGLLHRRRPLRDLAARRTGTLLIPYAFFSIIGFALYGVMGVYQAGDYTRQLAVIVLGTPSGAYRVPIQPQWFLLCLFTTEIAFALILLLAGGRRLRMLIAAAAMAAVGFVNSRTVRVELPWGTSTSLVAVSFYCLGDCFRNVTHALPAMKMRDKMLTAVLLGLVVVLAGRINGRVDMVYNRYGSIPVFLLGAVAGIAMTVLLSMLTEQAYSALISVRAHQATEWVPVSRLAARWAGGAITSLLYLGRNTLIILPMHMLVGRFTTQYLTILPLPSKGMHYELVEKLIMVLLLVASIEVFRRCPLVVPREHSRMARDPLRIRPDWPRSTPALDGGSLPTVAHVRDR